MRRGAAADTGFRDRLNPLCFLRLCGMQLRRVAHGSDVRMPKACQAVISLWTPTIRPYITIRSAASSIRCSRSPEASPSALLSVFSTAITARPVAGFMNSSDRKPAW